MISRVWVRKQTDARCDTLSFTGNRCYTTLGHHHHLSLSPLASDGWPEAQTEETQSRIKHSHK